MGLLHRSVVALFLVLHLSLITEGSWFQSWSEENETGGELQTHYCPRLERIYRRKCLRNPARRFCRRLRRSLMLGKCTPPCMSTSPCGDPEQLCQTDCDESNVVPGLCGRNMQCCLTDTGLDDCPTSDAGVSCETEATCSGSGAMVDAGFACGTDGEVCCRRQIQPCPESEPGMMCEASDTCTGSGGTSNTSFSCSSDGQVCCQRRTCPTADTGVSCETASTCTGLGATRDSSSSCPADGQVCCRRSCPVSPGSVMCESRCSVGFFELQGFPCPNAGELCCEIGLGRR